ncbi:LIM domain protein [Trifolium repens]|nr:LIM domain protein [Trifolium repens]
MTPVPRATTLTLQVDSERIPQIHSPMKDNNGCGGMVFSELIKLLLKEPGEKAVKHKSRNSSSQKSDAGPTTIITEHVVREYELHILFRMEIFQSEVGRRIEDSSKQKFVKQICLLLENIHSVPHGRVFFW